MTLDNLNNMAERRDPADIIGDFEEALRGADTVREHHRSANDTAAQLYALNMYLSALGHLGVALLREAVLDA